MRRLIYMNDTRRIKTTNHLKPLGRVEGRQNELFVLLYIVMLIMAVMFCLSQLTFVLPMLVNIVRRYHFYENNYLVVISLVTLFCLLLSLNIYFLQYSVKGIIKHWK